MITEPNNSITLTTSSGTGCPRKLNIYAYRVAGTRQNMMCLAILDDEGKLMADVVLDARGIRVLMKEIGGLI